jgi:TM2 domain-containing membrane protein YozV
MNLFDLSTSVILTWVISLILPLVSAGLSRIVVPPVYAGVITIVLAAITSFFTEWAGDANLSHYDWKEHLGIGLGSLFIALATHFGVWKSTPVEGKLIQLGARKKYTGEHELKQAA